MTTGAVFVEVDVRLRDPSRLPIDAAWMENLLKHAANRVGEFGEVSVSFVEEDEIQELNRTYRGVDRPTDVLSFSLLEGEFIAETIGVERPLGDIVISYPTAERQAAEYGHTVERELGFLLVHGFLHLVGFDHATPAQEARMFALQEEVLQQVGLPRENVDTSPQ